MPILAKFVENVNSSKSFLEDNPFVTGVTWDYLYDNFLERQVDSPFGGEYFLNVNEEKYVARVVANGMVRLYSIA